MRHGAETEIDTEKRLFEESSSSWSGLTEIKENPAKSFQKSNMLVPVSVPVALVPVLGGRVSSGLEPLGFSVDFSFSSICQRDLRCHF